MNINLLRSKNLSFTYFIRLGKGVIPILGRPISLCGVGPRGRFKGLITILADVLPDFVNASP